MQQYSIDKVELAWQGLDFKSGLAVGSSIVEGGTVPTWNQRTTAMGEPIRDYDPNRTGTLTVLVPQTSKLHRQLQTLALADRKDQNIVGPMMMTDIGSGDVFNYKNAYIMTDPDETRGTASVDYPWVFAFERVERKDSPNGNVVGN